MADHSDTGQRPVPGALFSMEAADNAEVIPTDLPRGPDSMWSTAANAEDVPVVTQALPPPPPGGWSPPPPRSGPESVDDEDRAWSQMGSPVPPRNGQASAGSGFGVGPSADPWSGSQVPSTPVGAPGAGGVFSAEPVVGMDDVVDEGEVEGELEDDWVDPPGASLFSSGPTINGASAGVGTGPGAPSFSNAAPANGAARGASPFAAPADPWNAWVDPAPARDERIATPPPFVSHDAAAAERRDEDPTAAVAADTHGLDVAVSRLRVEEQERARVPLSVCGALLEPGEQVVGVVTGQMLGRPAAVVVTRTRVMVVNDRRWQPIVDIYPIDDSLQVRGRHDHHVAALSFADDEHLSMVDGITEVEIAIGLAEAIRDPGTPDRGAGAAF